MRNYARGIFGVDAKTEIFIGYVAFCVTSEKRITWQKFPRCCGVYIGKFSRHYEVSRNGAARFSTESGRKID